VIFFKPSRFKKSGGSGDKEVEVRDLWRLRIRNLMIEKRNLSY
jgi:hypothetical protein